MNNINREHQAATQMTTLRIDGMSCGACVSHVSRALEGMTGVVHVEVDLPRQQASVEHCPDGVDEASLIAAIEGAGYRVQGTTRTARDADARRAAPTGCSTGCCCG
jgi:copper chaperone CopZ